MKFLFSTINLRRMLKIGILALFVLLNILNLPAGWADNGDYNRITQWFSSGPAFLPENFPPAGTHAWDRRFYSEWVPFWKLDFPLASGMFNSALLLWAPGILINKLLYSGSVLWAPLASLGVRLVLLALLWRLLNGLEHGPRPVLHMLTLALPLVLLFGTRDVAAFYNSFYQEAGTLVFLPLLLLVVGWGCTRPRDAWFYAAYAAAVLLLVTSKTAAFYWAPLALAFVLPLHKVLRQPRIYLPLAVGLVAVPLAAGLMLTHVPNIGPNRAYNALFGGVLQLSEAPQQRLTELGLAQSERCLALDWYNGGADCSRPDWDKISYSAVVRVLLAEPQIVLKQAQFMADRSQNLSLSFGQYAFGDDYPRRADRLNLWSRLKANIFPRGGWLAVSLLLLGAGIAATWKQPGLAGSLARVGLLCLLALVIDGYVEILGDGQRDLLKHLFIPNVLFDLALLAVFNALLARGAAAFGRKTPG